MEINKIYNEDCMDTMSRMPDCLVDLVLTSPPYNLGNSKKGSFYGGKGKGDRIKYDDHNDDMPTDKYIEWQHLLFKEWMRILKPTGAIFYNHKPRILNGVYDDRKNLIPFPIRQEIIWDRCGMVNFSGGFFAPNTEKIYIVAKPEWRPNKEFLGLGEVWRIPPDVNIDHPAPFPLALAQRIIVSSTNEGDIVYDPFMGSGTTAMACLKYKRNYIGSELTERYIQLSNKRLSPILTQGVIF